MDLSSPLVPFGVRLVLDRKPSVTFLVLEDVRECSVECIFETSEVAKFMVLEVVALFEVHWNLLFVY